MRDTTLDNRECSHRKCAEPLHFCRNRKEPEIQQWERCQVRHVFDDGNFVFQKNGVNRAPQILDIIDVVRIDSDQRGSTVCQKEGRVFGQERMPLEILRRVPVPGPACFDQHGLAREIFCGRKARDNDCLLVLARYFDGGEVRELLQFQLRQVLAIRIAVKRRIQIGPGIRHHLDLADLKLGSRRVVFPGGFTAQVVADDRGGKAFVGDEAVLDGVTEVDQSSGECGQISHGDGSFCHNCGS